MADRRNGDRSRVVSATSTPATPGALGDLVELLGGESERSRRFLGGLIAGALAGAALAGSALLRRRGGGGAR